jgi:hypothetical protein
MRSLLEIDKSERHIAKLSGGPSSAETGLDAFLRAHAGWIAIALTVYAAFRVLFFCAVFPLSNNVDERFHLLTIQMYAQGHVPGRDLPAVDPDFSREFLLYWSPEYWHTQQLIERDGASRPLYGLPPEAREAALSRDFYVKQLDQWARRPNFEAQSAPLYYIVAAGWYRLGEAVGMQDWQLDYWPKVLNPIAYALLVWFSYKFVREFYPRRFFLHLAVPALIAVFPQDVFFGMNRDVFSAPLCAAALLLMMRSLEMKPDRYAALLSASFLVGLAFLSSVSNFVLYGVLASTVWFWIRRSTATSVRKARVVLTSVLAAGALPSLWMLRNYLVMGDLTGGKAKTHDFGWTVKPLSQIFDHPLFSLRGAGYFMAELTRSFWRGEYVWHGVPMRSATADWFYLVSSVVLVATFVFNFVSPRREASSLQKLADAQALFLVAASILFLAVISLIFDFHDCQYPSRLLPYFVSGRIISGAMLPFALMYACGLELVLHRFHKWVPPVAVLACLLLFITASEWRVRRVALSSPYNFFALSAAPR